MRKIKPSIWKILYGLGVLVLLVQVALGVCWLLGNIQRVPDFVETQTLLDMSETWVLDEYASVLYVAVIFVTRWVEKLIGIPYQAFIYLLQFILALYAVRKVVKSILRGKKSEKNPQLEGWKIWLISLYVNTFPFLLQGHMAVLPYSLAASVYLLMLVNLLETIAKVKRKEELQLRDVLLPSVMVVCLWVTGAMILPEYFFLSGIVVLCGFFVLFFLMRSLRLWMMLIVTAGIVLAVFLPNSFVEKGSRGRIQDTFEAQAMRRLAWPHLCSMEACWPWDIVISFSEEELDYVSATPERVITVFGPRVEELFGKEKANKYYGEMAIAALRYNTKGVLSQVAADVEFYLCPQFGVARSIKGLNGTYTGQNYEKLQMGNERLTELFVRWSVSGFFLFVGLSLVAVCRTGIQKEWMAMGIISVFLQAIYYAWTTGGMVNYLKCPVILLVWAIFSVSFLLDGVKKEQAIDDCFAND